MATIDERIEKLEEKKEQLNQQVKQLKARKSQEERKARTKRLIVFAMKSSFPPLIYRRFCQTCITNTVCFFPFWMF